MSVENYSTSSYSKPHQVYLRKYIPGVSNCTSSRTVSQTRNFTKNSVA